MESAPIKPHRPPKLRPSRFSGSRRSLAFPFLSGRLSKEKRNEIRVAIIFVSLIIIPVGFLGYFSWRAIENEKLLSQKRLQESYRQFARLAGREIDDELEEVEDSWAKVIKKAFKKSEPGRIAETIADRIERKPLISSCFELVAPGRVAYPPDVSLHQQVLPVEPMATESFVREHAVFEKLSSTGEEYEYGSFELDRAIACYQEILSEVTHPQLRAMAESAIGRALIKKGDYSQALATFQNLLVQYPEARDLNKMYVRFLAQYQIAVCLENLEKDQQALEALLRLNQDLFDRSDAINTLQYSYFLDQIRSLAARLLASPKLSDAAGFQARFDKLAERNKKRISQMYFLQLLDRQLSKAAIKRKHYSSRLHYVSDQADGEPYLLVYRFIPDPSESYVTGLVALQIDLTRLSHRLFPAILRNLKRSEKVTLIILNEKNEQVIGTAGPAGDPIATRTLAPPFDFWQVAVYLNDASTLSRRFDIRAALGLWVVSLLLLSVLFGAYLFVRRARREAYLSRMKSTFVSNVSHELRTPLASIKMLAELLERQLAHRSPGRSQSSAARSQQYLSVIRRECDRLARLIENLLSFSRIEHGIKQYHFEYEDPGVVLRMVIDSFRPHAEAQGFSVSAEIPEDLPEVKMDADAISQVMLNLLSNAVKYSDEVKEIRVRAYQDGQQLLVEVSDRGIGIDSSELPKIFNDFYRVDQRLNAQKQGGVGLGLTLVRQIVHAHGGEVNVESEVGKGSTFSFSLPLVAGEEAAPTASPNAGTESLNHIESHTGMES